MDAYETVIQDFDALRRSREKREMGYGEYQTLRRVALRRFYRAHMLELLQYQEAQQAVGDVLGCEGTD